MKSTWKILVLIGCLLFSQPAGICAKDAAASAQCNIQDDLSNWSFYSGSNKDNGYKIGVDKTVLLQGKPSAYIQSSKAEQDQEAYYTAPYQEFKADRYRGKRVEFSAKLKTRGVSGAAGIWFKAMHDGNVIAFDDMDERSLKGSSDWQRYAVVLDVPEDADVLAIGVYLTGGGTMWFGGLSVTPVSTKVSLTEKKWDKKKYWRFDHSLRQEPVDLDFSEAAKNPASNVLLNWACHTSPSPGSAGLDRKMMLNGKPSAYIEQQSKDPLDFISSFQDISASHYLGKRVRLSGLLKTSGVTDWTGLWMRIDGGDSVLAFDNMADRPVKGDTDWRSYDVVLDVPSRATRIRLGFMLAGSGKSWLNSCTLTAVDKSVPVTAKSSEPSTVPSDIRATTPDLEFKTK